MVHNGSFGFNVTVRLLYVDLYIEWLRKEVSLTEEENCKLSAEISVIGETVFKGYLSWVFLVYKPMLVANTLLAKS